MVGFGDAIKYLYEKFILRDVLSFVTPGAIIVLTALYLFLPDLLSRSIHWLLYIPIFGLFYMVGFATQCLGEIFDIIRFTPRDQGCWRQRFKIFWYNWANPKNIWWKEAHEEMVKFGEATQGNEGENKGEWARQQHERLVVLKQMCGNGFLAIAIAGILLAVNHFFVQASLIPFFIVAFLLLVSLFWGYRVHVLRQDTIAKAIRHLPIDDKQEN